MKRIIPAALILFALIPAANAQLLLNENFSYTAGPLTTSSGGTWTQVSGSALSPVLVVASTAAVPNYDGYASSGIGNIAAIQNGFTQDVKRSFTPVDSGTGTGNKIFASFLVNVATRTG